MSFIKDRNKLVDHILRVDKDIAKLRDRYYETDSAVESEELHDQLDDMMAAKRRCLLAKSLPTLNEMFNHLYPTGEGHWKEKKPAPVKTKKLTKSMKKRVLLSRLSQEQGGPAEEQWSFLKWNKRASRDCKRAAVSKLYR